MDYYDDVSSTTLDLIQELTDQIRKEIKVNHQEKMERLEREVKDLKGIRDNWNAYCDKVRTEYRGGSAKKVEDLERQLAMYQGILAKMHTGELPRACDLQEGEQK